MSMGKEMNMNDLVRVNRLWEKIYPFIAGQILNYYIKDEGEVLEWGPFSGGISFSLLTGKPSLNIQIAVDADDVYGIMEKELAERGLTGKIKLLKSELNPMIYQDDRFGLIVIRGAYFFLDAEGASLREIFRVMKKGGVGFIGGGYGKNAPRAVIDEISEESRVLNDRLGRIRVTVDDLRVMVAKSGLGKSTRIIEEGGLWLVLTK